MSFPVFFNIPKTLANWSIKLSDKFQYIEEEASSYKLNQEVKTARKWIDGRPIYRKVFEISSFPNTTTDSYDLNIQYSKVVRAYGYIQEGAVVREVPYAITSGGSYELVEVCVDGDSLAITASSDKSGGEGHIVVEYLK